MPHHLIRRIVSRPWADERNSQIQAAGNKQYANGQRESGQVLHESGPEIRTGDAGRNRETNSGRECSQAESRHEQQTADNISWWGLSVKKFNSGHSGAQIAAFGQKVQQNGSAEGKSPRAVFLAMEI
jgi:hypothetical protein